MEKEKKNWFKEHSEMLTVIATVLTCFIITIVWIDGKFDKVNDRFTQVDNRITQVEKDIIVMKTILQIKNIMPQEVAKCEKKGE